MRETALVNGLKVIAASVIFAGGFLCGSLSQKPAQAELLDLGSDLLKRTSESGGLVGNLAKLGTSISEMEKHVNGMQKNIETLKSVKTALGGK